MKKILLICNYYAPDNMIAAVRTTKLSKYLSKAGYHVDVIAEQRNAGEEDPLRSNDVKHISIHYAVPGRLYFFLEKMYKALFGKRRKKCWDDLTSEKRYRMDAAGERELLSFQIAFPFWGTLDYYLDIIKQKSLCRSVKKYLCENKRNYDVCFSTYGSYFGHFCGMYLKKINPSILWIADFRDPVYNCKFNPQPTKYYAISYENKVYSTCDKIVVISKGMASSIVPEKYRQKVTCITNGYDLDDREKVNKIENSKFSFCYTGWMYGGMRKTDALFNAVKQLSDERKICLDDIEFHYAGKGFSVFEGQAHRSGLGSCCIDHGLIPHKESLKLQSESDILVVSTWESQDQYMGMLTGKALEYMSARKPIIALISGDAPECELRQVIREGNLGYAYMDIYADTDFEGLKEYILRQYRLFKAGQPLESNPDPAVVGKFDYRNLTDQLVQLIGSAHAEQ